MSDDLDRLPTYRLERAGYVCVVPGMDGLGRWVNKRRGTSIIHSEAIENDDDLWGHVSMGRFDRVLPTWEQIRDAFRLIYPDRYGIVVIPPADMHVNLAEVGHVWVNLNRDTVPDFTRGTGSI